MLPRIKNAVMLVLLSSAFVVAVPGTPAHAQPVTRTHVDAPALPKCSTAARKYGKLIERRTVFEGITREIYEYKRQRCAWYVQDQPTTSPRRRTR